MLSDGNSYKLLGILQSHAPNGSAQQYCSTMVFEAERDGAIETEIEEMLANVLSDGLTHGNWPWNAQRTRH